MAAIEELCGFRLPGELCAFYEDGNALNAAYRSTCANHQRLLPTYRSDFVWLDPDHIVSWYEAVSAEDWTGAFFGQPWPRWLVPVGQRLGQGDLVAIQAGHEWSCPVYWVCSGSEPPCQITSTFGEYVELSRAEMGANIYNTLASRPPDERASLAAGLEHDGFDVSPIVQAYAAATLRGMSKWSAVRAWLKRWHGMD